MKIRYISQADNGTLPSKEEIIFTDDFKAPVEDYLRQGGTWKITEDTILEITHLPSGFPLETSFRKI